MPPSTAIRAAGVTNVALGPALVSGSGFALPFLLAGVPIPVALVMAGRRTLR